MTTENTPATGTGEVSANESFEAYEARFLAGDAIATSKQSDAPASDEDAAKPASDSETEEDTEQEEEGEGEQPKAKGKGGFQRKIDKLTGKIRELETRLAGTAPAANAETSKETDSPAADTKAKPKLEDFDSVEDFTEALTDWKIDAKERDRTARQEQTSLIEAWNGRVSEVKAQHADYDSVIESANDIKLTAAHQRLFLDSEVGAQVAYNLASNRSDLEKFAHMPPLAAARYFGKLEAALSETAPARTQQPASSRAPKPPAHVNSRGAAVSSNPLDPKLADDYAAWEKARQAQLRRK